MLKPAAKFSWEDPFLLSQQLSDDETMVMDAARSYAQEKLQPGCSMHFALNQPICGYFGRWVRWAC